VAARIVLLRGINVGGKARLPMAELRELLAGLGFAGARTLLQTGNVVLDDARPVGELEAVLEAALAARFEFSPQVIARTVEEWAGVIAANPFPDEAKREPNRVVAVILKAEPAPQAVEALKAAATVLERVEVIGRTAFVHYPEGQADSRLSVEGKLKVSGTGRNWNTVLKLAEMAGA
jgi:uncharacterized protein (DUF1697 family)